MRLVSLLNVSTAETIMSAMPSTAVHWFSFVAIIWLQAISGTNTVFPAYATKLKDLLSISQLKLNILPFASDAGKLFSWFSGVATVYLPLWIVLLIGATFGFIGYGVQYLFVIGKIESLSYWQVFLLTVLSGNSICWLNTVCYVIAVRNLLFDRHVAVGLTTSYQGLSARIYIDIVGAVSPRQEAPAFLLLNSILPVIASLLAAPLVANIEFGRPRIIETRTVLMFVIAITTGIYVVVTSVHFPSFSISPSFCLIGISVSLLLPLVTPLAEIVMGITGEWYGITDTNLQVVYKKSIENGVVDKCSTISETNLAGDAEDGEIIGVNEDIGVKLMIRRIDFWLYFSVYFFGPTTGLVFMNNLGQIAQSDGAATASLVILYSSFGFFGRLLPAFMCYCFSRNKSVVSSPGSITLFMAPISGAFFLLVSRSNVALYISTAIIGLCTGSITSIAVSTTAELFGIENFSVNHNVVVANIPLGSFSFGLMAAFLYITEADEHGMCLGRGCYKNTFLIWGCLSIMGTLLALILYLRTRKFYSQIR